MNPDKQDNQAFNAGRKVARVGRVVGIIQTVFALIIVLPVIIGLAYLAKKSDAPNAVLAFIVLFGLLFVGMIVFILIRNMRKYRTYTPTETPFTGYQSQNVQVTKPAAAGVFSGTGTILAWLGPITKTGVANVETPLTEKLKAAENTIILTQDQFVIFALTQADFKTGGAVSKMGAFLGGAAGDAYGEKTTTEWFNMKQWEPFIQALKGVDLAGFMRTHYNFAYNRSDVRSVEIHKGLINRGIELHFQDGSHRRYMTLNQKFIEPFERDAQAAGVPLGK